MGGISEDESDSDDEEQAVRRLFPSYDDSDDEHEPSVSSFGEKRDTLNEGSDGKSDASSDDLTRESKESASGAADVDQVEISYAAPNDAAPNDGPCRRSF